MEDKNSKIIINIVMFMALFSPIFITTNYILIYIFLMLEEISNVKPGEDFGNGTGFILIILFVAAFFKIIIFLGSIIIYFIFSMIKDLKDFKHSFAIVVIDFISLLLSCYIFIEITQKDIVYLNIVILYSLYIILFFIFVIIYFLKDKFIIFNIFVKLIGILILINIIYIILYIIKIIFF